MPKNKILPYEWYNTPNIHLCSCKDFKEFCAVNDINVEKFICLNEKGMEIGSKFLSNVRAYQVLFCVSKRVK